MQSVNSIEGELSRFGSKALFVSKIVGSLLRFITIRWTGMKFFVALGDFVSHCLFLIVLFYGIVSTIYHFEIDYTDFFISFMFYGLSNLFVFLEPLLDSTCCKELQGLSNRLELLTFKIPEKNTNESIKQELDLEVRQWDSIYKHIVSKTIAKFVSFIVLYQGKHFDQ